jgi:hypothetical protein
MYVSSNLKYNKKDAESVLAITYASWSTPAASIPLIMSVVSEFGVL